MGKNKENSEKTENNSASLQDYEVEVNQEKGFFGRLIDRLRGKDKTAGYLNAPEGDTFQKTNRSISSMWRAGSFRTALMGKIESINKAVFGKQEESNKNTIKKETVAQYQQNRNDDVKETETQNIIPKSQSKAQEMAMNHTKVIPVAVSNDVKNVSFSDKTPKESPKLGVEQITVSEKFMKELENDSQNLEGQVIEDIEKKDSKQQSTKVSEQTTKKDQDREDER